MKSIIKMKIFKSALAFFFLFFLNGTSIVTRQQGISYNTPISATLLTNTLCFKELNLTDKSTNM
jgi:hypothetical protein